MKAKKTIAFLTLAASVLLMSMSEGYYQDDENGKAGYNGSPGELTCAKSSCHTTYALNSGPGSVTISAPGMTNWNYTPGQSYTIQVTIAQSGLGLFGFGFEALLASGANAGTLTAGTGSQALNATVTGNSRKTIAHVLNGGLSANSHTFSFTWIAPASGAPVTFYAAGNAANNNGSKSGDYIYTTSQVVTSLITPNAPTIVASGSTTLCNGASVTLNVTAQTGVTFTWYDQANNSVGTGVSFVASTTGCYHVVASSSGGTAQSANEICTIASAPDASFSGLSAAFCADDSPVYLTPLNSGGIFSGNGVTGAQFNPGAAGSGSHAITYTFTDSNGCTSSVTHTAVVNPVFDASFTGLQTTYCSGDSPVELIPLTPGGIFNGGGIVGNTFNPSVGPGNYTITYFIGTGNCIRSSSASVEVIGSADPEFSGLDLEYCSNHSAIVLTPVTLGGLFAGPGISGNSFDPATAGPGQHVITYSVISGNGCVSQSNHTVTINQSVTAAFTGLNPSYCSNADAVLLSPVTQGGVFQGTGISNNSFDPSVGQGNYDVIYSVGEGSCLTSSTQSTVVLPIDDASFVGLGSGFCSAADPVQLIPVTAGGIFSGNGIESDMFNPGFASVGANQVMYTVQSQNGCVSSSAQTVFVYETANSDFNGLQSQYCQDGELVILMPVNPGGVFVGDAVSDGVFDPTAVSVGQHIITYTIDFVGCGSSTSDTTYVYGIPDAQISGLLSSYCIDESPSTLATNSPNAVITGDGISGLSFDPAIAGTGIHVITCNATDEHGCFNTWQTEVNVKPLPIGTTTLEVDTISSNQNDAIYQWLDCGNANSEISGANDQSYMPLITGSYAVNVLLNGCEVTSVCVDVNIIHVENMSENILFEVYPNPANEFVICNASKPVTVSIYGIAGKLIYQNNRPVLRQRIQVSDFPAGVYEVQFKTDEKMYVKKLLIENEVK